MKHLALLLTLLIPPCALGQVRVMAQPLPLSTNFLNATTYGTWEISMVSMEPRLITLRLEEVRMALPALHRIPPSIAFQEMTTAMNKSTSQRIIRGLGYLDLIVPGVMGGGLIQASVKAVAATALGTAVTHHFTDNLRAQQPAIETYQVNQCPDEIVLQPYGQPGYGLTCRVFAGKVKGASTMGPVEIRVPPPVAPAPLPPQPPASAAQPAKSELSALPRADQMFVIVWPFVHPAPGFTSESDNSKGRGVWEAVAAAGFDRSEPLVAVK